MKRIVHYRLIPLLGLLLFLNACNKSETINNPAPVITFDNPSLVYKVKLGQSLVLNPQIENDINADYFWKLNNVTVSREKTYTYTPTGMPVDELYLTFEVKTPVGSDSKELRIEVIDFDIPFIGLAVPEGGYIIAVDTDLTLDPVIDAKLPTTYLWKVDNATVSTEPVYTFSSSEVGSYEVSLTTTNADGTDQAIFSIHTRLAENLPFSWVFDQTVFSMAQGRQIRLMPYDIRNAGDAVYTWTVNAVQVQQSADPAYLFDGTASGTYTVTVTMQNAGGTKSQTLTVEVDGPEGTHRRAVSGNSSPNWNEVYEFLAGPGQFVNAGYTATTMAQAVSYAKGRLTAEDYVSLGGFGGYLVVGFDHSVENSGGYDIQVKGNYGGSEMAEAGVVWVMQDENGNGLPDDTWYELKGSEYDNPETVQDYAITYYRPRTAGGTVAWEDNQGQNGKIKRTGYHTQEYYPGWVTGSTYTLRGTKLRSTVRESSGMWQVEPFAWGYADNPSTVDNLGMSGMNHFRISDAVRFDGQPANLQYIDFVKVQCGVNASAGILGEVSTEVCTVRDYNLIK